MNLLSLFKKPALVEQPLSIPVGSDQPLPMPIFPQGSLPLDDLYGCLDCRHATEGAINQCCKRCGSSAIWHIESTYAHIEKKAAQRLKRQGTINAALIRNDLNTLTECRLPDAAAKGEAR